MDNHEYNIKYTQINDMFWDLDTFPDENEKQIFHSIAIESNKSFLFVYSIVIIYDDVHSVQDNNIPF